MEIRHAAILVLAITLTFALAGRRAAATPPPALTPTPTAPPMPTQTPGSGGGAGQTTGTPTATPLSCNCAAWAAFQLTVVDSTAIEIALAWQQVQVPGLTIDHYTVTRCDPRFSTDVDKTINAYGDTGQAANAEFRFALNPAPPNPSPRPTPYLQPGQPYMYQVKAVLSDQSFLFSNCVTAQLRSLPTPRPRRTPGDLWADVVLGKPDPGNFGGSGFGTISNLATNIPGGVVVDRSVHPARVYLGDPNNNRIFGFDHIGHCTHATCNPATLTGCCTEDTDCAGGETCALDYPNLAPAIVLGQTSSENAGACNGDATGQFYPDRASASRSSLCLKPAVPPHVSIVESVYAALMAPDGYGNLYVSDMYNNRVLKYSLPSSGPLSQVTPAAGLEASDVWGQVDAASGQIDFTGNLCDRGVTNQQGIRQPSNNSLCLEGDKHAGITIDDAGNLWVADIGNHRVLRFPRANGQISHTADVVLGQSSFGAVTPVPMSTPSSFGQCSDTGERCTSGADCVHPTPTPNSVPTPTANGSPTPTYNSYPTPTPNCDQTTSPYRWCHDTGVSCSLNEDCPNSFCDGMHVPYDVAFDPGAHVLYVVDAGSAVAPAEDSHMSPNPPSRILKYTKGSCAGSPMQCCTTDADCGTNGTCFLVNDFQTDQPACEIPITRPPRLQSVCCLTNPSDSSCATAPYIFSQVCDPRPVEITLDTSYGNLWVRYEREKCIERVNVQTGAPSWTFNTVKTGGVCSTSGAQSLRGMDVDRSGNLMVVEAVNGLFRLERANIPGAPSTPGDQVFNAGQASVSEASLDLPQGVTVLSDPNGMNADQLIVSDDFRLLIWNNFSSVNLTHNGNPLANGERADDLWGEPDFGPGPPNARYDNAQHFWFPQVDKNGRLWVYHTCRDGAHPQLLVLNYPIDSSQKGTCTNR